MVLYPTTGEIMFALPRISRNAQPDKNEGRAKCDGTNQRGLKALQRPGRPEG
jgi:hypothetical protein